MLLNTVGHKFLEATKLPSDSSSETDIFTFEGRDYSATGTTTSNGFVVFKNSTISKKANYSLRQSIINKRSELITQKVIDENYGSNSRFMFKGDTDIDPIMPITIHYPLIKFFQASINYH